MTLVNLILITLKASIVISVFALGLKSTFRDVTYLLHRPGELVRSLLSMYILMLLLAIVLAHTFDLHSAIKIALVALAVSPVPPVLPSKAVKAGGDAAYTIGLLVVAALFSIVFIPLAFLLLEKDEHY